MSFDTIINTHQPSAINGNVNNNQHNSHLPSGNVDEINTINNSSSIQQNLPPVPTSADNQNTFNSARQVNSNDFYNATCGNQRLLNLFQRKCKKSFDLESGRAINARGGNKRKAFKKATINEPQHNPRVGYLIKSATPTTANWYYMNKTGLDLVMKGILENNANFNDTEKTREDFTIDCVNRMKKIYKVRNGESIQQNKP